MTTTEGIAMAALVVTLVLHTSALFYWGGRVSQMLRDHDRRLTTLEGG